MVIKDIETVRMHVPHICVACLVKLKLKIMITLRNCLICLSS